MVNEHLVEIVHDIVFARACAIAQLAASINDDLGCRSLQQRHRLLDEGLQLQGAFVTAFINEVGINPRWRNFQDVHAGVAQREALGKRIRVDGGFGRGIEREHCHRNKSSRGAIVDDVRQWLAFQVFDERATDTYRCQQVRVYQVSGLCIVERARYIVERHDAGVIDDDIQFRVLMDEICRDAGDLRRVTHVDFYRIYTRVGLGDFIQQCLAAAADNYLVSFTVKGLGKPASNARSCSCNKYSIATDEPLPLFRRR